MKEGRGGGRSALVDTHPLSSMEAAFVSRQITFRVVDSMIGLLTGGIGCWLVLPFRYSWTAQVILDYQKSVGTSQLLAAHFIENLKFTHAARVTENNSGSSQKSNSMLAHIFTISISRIYFDTTLFNEQ